MILILFIYTKEIKYIKNTKEKKRKDKKLSGRERETGQLVLFMCVCGDGLKHARGF